MSNFKRIFSRFLHPKSRRQLRERGAVTPTPTNVVMSGEPGPLRGHVHPVPESIDQNVVQPVTDAVVEELEQSDSESESQARDTPPVEDVQTVQPSTDKIPTKVENGHQDGDSHEEYDDIDEDYDIPEIFSCDLARKTHYTKIFDRLYVAVTDDDSEIAALQALHPKKFTHIVRVAFDPPSDEANIKPSSWAVRPDFVTWPHTLHLTCPALTLQYDGKRTALNEEQIRIARNFITFTLPARKDTWAELAPKFPIPLDLCIEMKTLIITPPNRSVDAMTILVCYMAFLSGSSAERALGALKLKLRLDDLGRSHWAGNILGQESLDVANVVCQLLEIQPSWISISFYGHSA